MRDHLRVLRRVVPHLLVAYVAFAWLELPGASANGPTATPAASGLYEGWSAITLAPFGPLTAAQTGATKGKAPLLPRWLQVTSTKNTTDIVFQPDGRVTWQVVYGPRGPTSKDTRVDGKLWTRTEFGYDKSGRLATKKVSGPGIGRGTREHGYQYDAQTRRAQRHPKRGDGVSLSWVWQRKSVTVETRIRTAAGKQGPVLRTDRYDRAGRLLTTALHFTPGSAYELHYVRDKNGRLRHVERRWPGARRQRAEPDKPISGIRGLPWQRGVPVEMHEIRLLFGRPATLSDSGKGTARQLVDDYAGGQCFLNASNGYEYGPTGLVKDTQMDCICGFCVAASDNPTGVDVLGRDLHWTTGPWVRLNGSVDVTVDHPVLTPKGPVPAGQLAVGDEVLTRDGTVATISSVDRLAGTGERLGVNLRTRSGVFAAGGLLFQSEEPRHCETATQKAPGPTHYAR